MLYSVIKCDNSNIKNDSSYIQKGNSKIKEKKIKKIESSYIQSSDNKIKQEEIDNIDNYPKAIYYLSTEFKSVYILTELYDGNLEAFNKTYYKRSSLLQNALVQLYLSLFFFYQETNHFHIMINWNKYIYYKIKPGGYFHYKIFGEDYYLENLGFLWTITSFTDSINFNLNGKNKYQKIYICVDTIEIICFFINGLGKKWVQNIQSKFIPDEIKITYGVDQYLEEKYYKVSDSFNTIVKNIFNDVFIDNCYMEIYDKATKNYVIAKYDRNYNSDIYNCYISFNDNITKYKSKNPIINDYIFYTPDNMNRMIKVIMTAFKKHKIILTEVKDKTNIINKTPYVLSLFRDT